MAQLGIFERLRDEQDGIRAGGARFVDLIRVDDDILREERHTNGLSDRDEVAQRSAPMPSLGENGDRSGSGRNVPHRLRNRVEGLHEDTQCGRDSLDLRDHREARSPIAHCLIEVIERALRADLSLREDPIVGHGRARGGHIRPALANDLLEKVAHTAAASAAPTRWLVATKRTRTSFASPLSIASAASLAPSRMSLASPAT